jgi:hypothetical protein
MQLSELLEDVVACLSPGQRRVVDELAKEYGADGNFRFLLALAAGASPRERRLLRLLLNDLEQLAAAEKK